MDKSDYVRLLKESSNDETKFRPVNADRPKMRGRPPKHFSPLLQQEKELTAAVLIFCDGTFLRNYDFEVLAAMLVC